MGMWPYETLIDIDVKEGKKSLLSLNCKTEKIPHSIS
jgi:hypothetical protein